MRLPPVPAASMPGSSTSGMWLHFTGSTVATFPDHGVVPTWGPGRDVPGHGCVDLWLESMALTGRDRALRVHVHDTAWDESSRMTYTESAVGSSRTQ